MLFVYRGSDETLKRRTKRNETTRKRTIEVEKPGKEREVKRTEEIKTLRKLQAKYGKDV